MLHASQHAESSFPNQGSDPYLCNGRTVFFFFFNWRIIALQCCTGFCRTTTWISHNYIYIFPPSLEPPSYPTTIPPPRLSQSARLGCLWYIAASHWLSIFTHDTVYMSMLLSQFVPPSPSPTVPTSLFSMQLHSFPENRYNFSGFHIYHVCFSLSAFTLCNQALGSFTSLQLTQICYFLWLSNIPLDIHTTTLSIHLSMDIYVASISWLL